MILARLLSFLYPAKYRKYFIEQYEEERAHTGIWTALFWASQIFEEYVYPGYGNYPPGPAKYVK